MTAAKKGSVADPIARAQRTRRDKATVALVESLDRRQKRAPHDARTAWRNMKATDRSEFLAWLAYGPARPSHHDPAHPPVPRGIRITFGN